MKEATGEVSMTVVTIVAIAVIGGIVALLWPTISRTISNSWGNTGREACEGGGGTWNEADGTCVRP